MKDKEVPNLTTENNENKKKQVSNNIKTCILVSML